MVDRGEKTVRHRRHFPDRNDFNAEVSRPWAWPIEDYPQTVRRGFCLRPAWGRAAAGRPTRSSTTGLRFRVIETEVLANREALEVSIRRNRPRSTQDDSRSGARGPRGLSRQKPF